MSKTPSVTSFYIGLLCSEKEQMVNILIFDIKVNTLLLSLHEKIKSLKSNASEYSTFVSISIINVLLLIFFISTDIVIVFNNILEFIIKFQHFFPRNRPNVRSCHRFSS